MEIMFSAMYSLPKGFEYKEYTISCKKFPSRKELISFVQNLEPKAKNIAIMGFYKFSQKEFNNWTND